MQSVRPDRIGRTCDTLLQSAEHVNEEPNEVIHKDAIVQPSSPLHA